MLVKNALTPSGNGCLQRCRHIIEAAVEIARGSGSAAKGIEILRKQAVKFGSLAKSSTPDCNVQIERHLVDLTMNPRNQLRSEMNFSGV
jgi:hypothetical protein